MLLLSIHLLLIFALHHNFHSVFVQTLAFGEIPYNKGVFNSCRHIPYSEVVPLLMSFCVSIYIHKQVVMQFISGMLVGTF